MHRQAVPPGFSNGPIGPQDVREARNQKGLNKFKKSWFYDQGVPLATTQGLFLPCGAPLNIIAIPL